MAEAAQSLAGGETGERRFFHTLDLMRGLAAIAVMTLHLEDWLLWQPFPQAYLAVDLFFILSGVVIDNAYRRRLAGGLSVGAFMAVRLIRLWPLYLLGLVLAAVVAAGGLMRAESRWSVELLALAFALGALFLPMLGASPVANVFPLNGPSWSLSFELFVNYAYALLARRLRTPALVVVALVSAVLLAGVALRHGNVDVGATTADWVLAFPRVVFGFTVGVLIARVRAGAPARARGVEVVAVGALLVIAFHGPPAGMPLPRAAWDMAFVMVAFPLLVYRGTVADCPPWMRGAATFLGVTSYAVYVLHIPLSVLVVQQVDRLTHGLVVRGAPYTGVTVILAMLLAAWAADRWYDAPVRRWLTRRRAVAGRPLPTRPSARTGTA